MSDPLDSRIGEVLQRVDFPVEAGKVREFARAIGDGALMYANYESAKQAVAPPTFTTVALHYSESDYTYVARALDLDMTRLVHGEHAWTYHQPVSVGDVLHGETTLVSVSQRPARSGGTMRLIAVGTEYRNGAHALAVSEMMTMVELPARA